MKRETVRTHFKTKGPKALAFSSSSIALSIGSPSFDFSGVGIDEPGSSKESGWRTAYGAARMAIEIAGESSDMFLPLKAVVGALVVLIKNYDVKYIQASGSILTAHRFLQQTTANAEQITDIEERVQSLAEILASPLVDQDSAEKVRREALRKLVLHHSETPSRCSSISINRRKLAGIITKLGPLSEQHGILKFLKNVDHANTLNGFVQDLSYAVTDYQVRVVRPAAQSNSCLV